MESNSTWFGCGIKDAKKPENAGPSNGSKLTYRNDLAQLGYETSTETAELHWDEYRTGLAVVDKVTSPRNRWEFGTRRLVHYPKIESEQRTSFQRMARVP